MTFAEHPAVADKRKVHEQRDQKDMGVDSITNSNAGRGQVLWYALLSICKQENEVRRVFAFAVPMLSLHAAFLLRTGAGMSKGTMLHVPHKLHHSHNPLLLPPLSGLVYLLPDQTKPNRDMVKK